MNNANLINQDSGNFEYYTDMRIVNAARRAMRSIDLDPASSKQANERIKANKFFTKKEDGLKMDWFGNVFLNHPFSKGWKACDDTCNRKTCADRGFHIHQDIPSNLDWVYKLVSEYIDGEVNQACCITYASTSEKWFKPLLDFPQCYLSPRTNYYLPDGTLKRGVTKGSVITYLGHDVKRFIKIFDGHFGTVKI